MRSWRPGVWEAYGTNVFYGRHNVRGAWDSIGDLKSGLLGTLVYVGIAVGGAKAGKTLASFPPETGVLNTRVQLKSQPCVTRDSAD